MPEIGDAYYPGDIDSTKSGVPEGRYTAKVVGLELIKDLSFKKHIADIFKPEYEIDSNKHPEFALETVLDSGIFRYKQKDGYLYDPKKNWGFVKFMSIMGLYDKGEEGQLPFLYLNDINGSVVLIDVFIKKFKNEYEKDVRYPVARLVQIVDIAEVPF